MQMLMNARSGKAAVWLLNLRCHVGFMVQGFFGATVQLPFHRLVLGSICGSLPPWQAVGLQEKKRVTSSLGFAAFEASDLQPLMQLAVAVDVAS